MTFVLGFLTAWAIGWLATALGMVKRQDFSSAEKGMYLSFACVLLFACWPFAVTIALRTNLKDEE